MGLQQTIITKMIKSIIKDAIKTEEIKNQSIRGKLFIVYAPSIENVRFEIQSMVFEVDANVTKCKQFTKFSEIVTPFWMNSIRLLSSDFDIDSATTYVFDFYKKYAQKINTPMTDFNFVIYIENGDLVAKLNIDPKSGYKNVYISIDEIIQIGG